MYCSVSLSQFTTTRQAGSIQSFSLLLCLSFISLLSLYTVQRYKQWFSLKKNLEQIICVKKFHHETKNLVSFVHRINQVIVAENIIQLASIFFPQTWIGQPTLAKVKKALKLAQTVKVLAYYKTISGMLLDQCRLSLRTLQTPFKINGLSLKRNFQGLTILRRKQVKLCHILSYQLICSQFNYTSSLNTSLDIKTSATYFPRRL